MIRSKISRSIVVVVFIALVIFLGYLDIRCILETSAQPIARKALKLGYALLLISLLILYVYIKDKLYKIKMKRSQSLVIRYIFLAIIVIIANIVKLKNRLDDVGITLIITFVIINLISSFIIKKVIFNVSKSDILSVIGFLAYSILPIAIDDNTLYFNSILIVLFVFATILNLQILIDELKQRGIKTKKYLVLSLCLGIFMGISSLLGINYLVWIALCVLLLVITINLDNTHINFPRKVMQSITQENREKLYSIERINISKLIICLLTISVTMLITYYIGVSVLDNLFRESSNSLIQIVSVNIQNNKVLNINDNNFSFGKFKQDSKAFVQFSKDYYLILFIYIVLIEILNVMLKRRYDTKSTTLKAIFILSYVSMSVFNINICILQTVFSIMLVLIALVNTSNIYLNREERVKMLVA